MKPLLFIKDGEIKKMFKLRKASRGVLFDRSRRIPMLFVSKYGYHKLPGGGMEDNESALEALEREVKEEVGATIKVNGIVGSVAEVRSEWNLKQISYCYFGDIVSLNRESFRQDEIDQGFRLVWMSLDRAIAVVEKDKPTNYEGAFVQKRDLAFLREARKIIQNNGNRTSC